MDTAEPTPARTFHGALRALYREAGEPSVRKVAEDAENMISHTAVHDVLRGRNYPSWRVAAKIITALGEDPEGPNDLRALWKRDRPAERGVSVLPPQADVIADLITALGENTAALDRLAAAIQVQTGMSVRPPGYPAQPGTF